MIRSTTLWLHIIRPFWETNTEGNFQTRCCPMNMTRISWVADGRDWAGGKGRSSDMAAWERSGQAHKSQ